MFKKTVFGIILLSCIIGVSVGQIISRRPNIQIVIFSADNCRYCVLLDKYILQQPDVESELNKFAVYHLNISEAKNNKIRRQWKITSVPTVVAFDLLPLRRVKILERWQLNGEDNNNYERNKEQFLKFLSKYSPKQA